MNHLSLSHCSYNKEAFDIFINTFPCRLVNKFLFSLPYLFQLELLLGKNIRWWTLKLVFIQELAMSVIAIHMSNILLFSSTDRVFCLQHFITWWKKQRSLLLSHLLKTLFLCQSDAHAPLQCCQSPSKIMSISLLHCIFSQPVCCLRFQIHKKPLKSLYSNMMHYHQPCH